MNAVVPPLHRALPRRSQSAEENPPFNLFLAAIFFEIWHHVSGVRVSGRGCETFEKQAYSLRKRLNATS